MIREGAGVYEVDDTGIDKKELNVRTMYNALNI